MQNKSSSFNLIEKAFRLSFSNIWRNKFLSIATIFVIGTIIFIFNVIIAVNFIAKDALNDLSKKIDAVIYLKESTTFADAQKMIEDLNRTEGVFEVVYTSKDDALAKLKATHPDVSIAFEKYALGNPLPASINITTTHPKYHPAIAKLMEQDKYQAYLTNVVTTKDSTNSSIITSVTKNLLTVTNFAQQIIFWIILIFVIGGALIILNALQITIFHRKKEIEVMKLVGASHWFIRLPYLMESIIYGVFAMVISFAMLIILSQKIQITETQLWNYYSGIEFYKIFLIELAATIFLCIFSSMIAVHEYLNKKLLDK